MQQCSVWQLTWLMQCVCMIEINIFHVIWDFLITSFYITAGWLVPGIGYCKSINYWRRFIWRNWRIKKKSSKLVLTKWTKYGATPFLSNIFAKLNLHQIVIFSKQPNFIATNISRFTVWEKVWKLYLFSESNKIIFSHVLFRIKSMKNYKSCEMLLSHTCSNNGQKYNIAFTGPMLSF